MDPIFDPQAAMRNRLRARRLAEPGADFLMARAAEDLADRLSTVQRRFAHAAAIWCETGHARDVLLASGKVDALVDVPRAAPHEVLDLEPASLELAVSLLAFHDVDDLPGLLLQIRRALRPDGLFVACFAGGDTLNELRASLLAAESELTGGAAPRVAPFADVRDGGALLQRAGFALPVADVETVTVRYDTIFHLMRDLRAMGAANALAGRPRHMASRRLFLRAGEIYAERFADADGRLRATFSTIWVSGWAPDASQRKPLRPGSARVSLAKALEEKG